MKLGRVVRTVPKINGGAKVNGTSPGLTHICKMYCKRDAGDCVASMITEPS